MADHHPWWTVYELVWKRTHFIQREPWLTCSQHGCWIPI